jgi:hypothetical protein
MHRECRKKSHLMAVGNLLGGQIDTSAADEAECISYNKVLTNKFTIDSPRSLAAAQQQKQATGEKA